MVTYKTIVVPTDGSENAKRALEHALAVADRNKAELIIVHVANIVSAISNFDQTPFLQALQLSLYLKLVPQVLHY